MDELMNGWMDELMNRWMDWWMDGAFVHNLVLQKIF